MEALVFDGQNLSLTYVKDRPIPTVVEDTDVVIKVEYSGVCSTDLHIMKGEYPAIKERPITLGHEFSGTVHDAGKKSVFKKGQKVVVDPNGGCNLCEPCGSGKYHYCASLDTIGIWKDGGWAQYARVRQEQVYALPEDMTTEIAGLCEPYSCVSHGYHKAAPWTVGERILVIGAGVIGNLWITALHHHGHRDVTVCETIQARLDIVQKINTGYRLVKPNDLAKEGAQFDVIVDCTGVAKVIEMNIDYLRHGGKYVVFGCSPQTHTALINPFKIYEKELVIIGCKVNPFSFPRTIKWMKAMGPRYINYDTLGIRKYKLSEYKQALDDLKAGIISKGLFVL